MRILATDVVKTRVVASIKEGQNKSPMKDDAPFEPDKEPSSVDEAFQHAKSYWMMGWTWEEIDALLEDMGYNDKTIDSVTKKTQEYAYEVLKEGPFNLFKDAQYIALRNGKVGRLQSVNKDHVSLSMDDGDTLIAGMSVIDFEKTAKLTAAHSLRMSAEKIFKEADELTSPGIKPMAPTQPGEPLRETVHTQEEKFDLGLTPKKQVPHGWAKDIPSKFSDVEQASEDIQEMSELVLIIRQQADEAKKSWNEAKSLAKDKKTELTKYETELEDTGKELASILGAEQEAQSMLDTKLFRRFDEMLVGYRNYIETNPEEITKIPGLVDKHAQLVEIIQEKVPDAFEEIMTSLDEWFTANTRIIETIKETEKTDIALLEPPKKTLGQKEEGWWGKIKGWISSAWKKIRQSTDLVTKKSLPAIDEVSDAIEDFLDAANQQQLAANIKQSLRVRL